MTIYITQGRYTRDAIIGMIDKPEDRARLWLPWRPPQVPSS